MFNQYWWVSNSSQGRGVKWHSWDNKSKSKDRWVLGFRSLRGSNIALLGKHVWKCKVNPSLLVSCVLKARYFPDVHILKVVKCQGSSYMWMGIWSTKEALKYGLDGLWGMVLKLQL